METTRSKPMPVSTCLAGSSTKVPSGLALNWMKTRFQISMQRASPLLTSSRPAFWRSSGGEDGGAVVVGFLVEAGGVAGAGFVDGGVNARGGKVPAADDEFPRPRD